MQDAKYQEPAAPETLNGSSLGQRRWQAQKEKLNTRGAPKNQMDVTLLSDAPRIPARKGVFKLRRKSLPTLDLIFPDIGETFLGIVAWQDFLNFMVDIGFSIDPVGGSVFTFIMRGKGRISIHQPHPDSTLQPHHLRNIGTGLEEAFGWTRENFVEVEA